MWERDPIAIAIQNNLAIFIGNFPMGRSRGYDIQGKIVKVFGKTLCDLQVKNGHFKAKTGKDCPHANIPNVHGFFHITDLDFYRSKIVSYWSQNLIGDCYLCRRFDDQLAVTVPPAMLDPTRAWDMYSNGVVLNISHNFRMDGKKNQKLGGFFTYWRKHGRKSFPEVNGKCRITEGG